MNSAPDSLFLGIRGRGRVRVRLEDEEDPERGKNADRIKRVTIARISYSYSSSSSAVARRLKAVVNLRMRRLDGCDRAPFGWNAGIRVRLEDGEEGRRPTIGEKRRLYLRARTRRGSALVYRPFTMQDRVTPLISKILASYQEIGGINNIDGTNLPSKRAITQICEDLLQILFPGFHDEKPIATEKIPQITSGRILSIVDRLRVEAFKSLRLNEPECPSRRADQIVLHLIGELQPIRELLQTDVEAAYEGDPASTSYNEIIVSYPCIEAIAIQRLAHILYRDQLPSFHES